MCLSIVVGCCWSLVVDSLVGWLLVWCLLFVGCCSLWLVVWRTVKSLFVSSLSCVGCWLFFVLSSCLFIGCLCLFVGCWMFLVVVFLAANTSQRTTRIIC